MKDYSTGITSANSQTGVAIGSPWHPALALTFFDYEIVNETEFWAIVESAKTYDGKQLMENFQASLGKLTEDELQWFAFHHANQKVKCYTRKIRAFSNVIFGGCGDSNFSNFITWIPLQGKTFTEKMIANPDALTDELKKYSYIAEELVGFVAYSVGRERFGDDFDMAKEAASFPGKPIGKDIEGEDYATHFPRAYAAFNDAWLDSDNGGTWPYNSK